MFALVSEEKWEMIEKPFASLVTPFPPNRDLPRLLLVVKKLLLRQG